MRSRCVTLFCVALVAALPTSAGAAAAAPIGGGQWSPPVDGRVVRPFDPPDTQFGPGHLGVDFATAPATPVRAAGDGIVVFAGRVGEGLHVVVRHTGDIRTTASFLASVDVVTGQTVRRGSVVGTSGGTGPGHSAGVVHFGVRVGATYVDPMLLFETPDLAAVVHLAAPRGGAVATSGSANPSAAPAAGERAALVGALRVDARPIPVPPVWWHEARADRRSERAARASPDRRPSVTTNSPGSTRGVVAVAAISVTGVVAARTRRRIRRS